MVAVAARSLEDANAFAKKFNIPKAYGSYEELVKDGDVGEYNTYMNMHIVWVLSKIYTISTKLIDKIYQSCQS